MKITEFYQYLIFVVILHTGIAYSQIYDITSFGAVGDGNTINTDAIQQAIDSCYRQGGGVVLIPAGNFVSGTLILKDNVTLEIARDGVLIGSRNIQDYPDIIPQIRSYADNYPQKSLIYAENARNIKLTGEGTINGNGVYFSGNDRPMGIRFISCRNVVIENLELRSSGFRMMHSLNIDTLIIRNISIFNHGNSNNDGITIDGCRNVLVENCDVDSSDDPMVLKASAPVNCEDVEIRNSRFATFARAIKIGTETTGGFRNIHIHDCTVGWSDLSIPPFLGWAACGINLAIVDGGFMENVLVENVSLDGVGDPVLIRLGDRGRKHEPSAPDPPVGYCRNITLRNISIRSYTNMPVTVSGIPGHDVEDVTLSDVELHTEGGHSGLPAGYTVPENAADKPDCDMFGELPASGLYCRHVRNITITGFCVEFENPDARSFAVFDDVKPAFDTSIVATGNRFCLSTSYFPSGGIKFPDVDDVLHVYYENEMLHILSGPGGEILPVDKVTIYELTGRVCKVADIHENTGMAILNVENLPMGVFLLVIQSEGKQWVGKFARL